jgi:hypothetical protein
MLMKMITDPLPTVDPVLPAMRQAIHIIRLQLMLVETECPGLTPRQQLAEARRRSHKAMAEAADAIEARRYGLLG